MDIILIMQLSMQSTCHEMNKKETFLLPDKFAFYRMAYAFYRIDFNIGEVISIFVTESTNIPENQKVPYRCKT